MDFKVSVIIPVFNAADFIEEAVKSALSLKEVVEIIIVEDNSHDASLKICQRLALDNKNVFLYRHPGGINRGEAASRNLGISKATSQFIAFLDADDWYYPNRFKKDIEVFKSDPSVKISYSYSTINFPNGRIIPYGENVDFLLKLNKKSTLKSQYRHVIENDLILGHVNANTVHKDVFNEGDFWDDRLKVHTDTEFWWRLNRKYKFHASELKNPVSAARRHDHNTIYNRSFKTMVILQLVRIDNIGVGNLEDFEKKVIIYHLSRALSNHLKNHFWRKSVLHGFQLTVNLFRSLFISSFYRWGMKRFHLYRS